MDTTIKPPNISSEPPHLNNLMEEDDNLSHSYKKMLLNKKVTTQSQYYENESLKNNIKDKGKENLVPIILSQDDKDRPYPLGIFS